MKPVATSARILVNAPVSRVFAVAAGTHGSDFVNPRWPLPGIAESRGALPWTAPGETRIHNLTDGSSVDEYLTAFSMDEYFAYRVSGFTGPFGALVTEARGRWRFDWRGPHKTELAWDYAFTPKSGLARPLASLIVKQFWPGYLIAALKRVKKKAEKPDA